VTKKLFLVCTETSGDLLAGSLLEALAPMVDDLTVTGVGGDRCLAAGMRPLYHVHDFNVMGLVEVLSQLKRLKAMFNELVEALRRDGADAVVLVDAPDFNLRFAKAIGDLGIPVIYYVSPQVWAWRKSRAEKIADLVDHMMVLFRFETEIYEKLGLATTWVGHPLIDELGDFGDRTSFLRTHGLDPAKPLVALAPGSRVSVVNKLLPTMAEIAVRRADRYQFVLPLARAIDPDYFAARIPSEVKIMPGLMRPVMAHADGAVVASGTATLETALLGTPMLVGYRLKRLSYMMATRLIKLPHVALVNIVLEAGVVPELIQNEFCAEKVVPLLDRLMTDEAWRLQMQNEFDRLEHILGGGGASERAARVVKGFLAT